MVGSRWQGAVAALGLVALLAACASGPQYPLMSPLEVAKSFGYADQAIGDNRYEVTYIGPPRRASRFASERDPVIAAARTQAFDFALWRAAQIALARGFVGFRIANVRTNVDTYIQDYYGDPFYDPLYPGFRRRFGPFGPPFYPPYYPAGGDAYVQARVSFEATLLQATGPGDYEARSVIDQLRGTYPGAEGLQVDEQPTH